MDPQRRKRLGQVLDAVDRREGDLVFDLELVLVRDDENDQGDLNAIHLNYPDTSTIDGFLFISFVTSTFRVLWRHSRITGGRQAPSTADSTEKYYFCATDVEQYFSVEAAVLFVGA